MKIEFGSTKEFEDWITGKENKYELYIVRDTRQLIALPLVSTRPVKIGVAYLGEGEPSEYLKKMELKRNIKVYLVEAIDFQVEK